MTVLTCERLSELADFRSQPCLSLYLPSDTWGGGAARGREAIAELRDAAHRMLCERGMHAKIVSSLLEPLEGVDLVNCCRAEWHPSCEEPDGHVDDRPLSEGDGVAIFCARQFTRSFGVPLRLPKRLIIADRFYVRPLLTLLQDDTRFYVLALTPDSFRLYEATRSSIRPVAFSSSAPLAEASGLDVPRAASSGWLARRWFSDKRPVTIDHGAGQRDILGYFHQVNRQVMEVLQHQQAPLVLACIGYLAVIYNAANRYSNLLKSKVPGAPERWTITELRDNAWRIVAPYFHDRKQLARAQLDAALSCERGSSDVEEIVCAAGEGRVETLFVGPDFGGAGADDPLLVGLESPKAPETLLEYAATRTLSSGGRLCALESRPVAHSPMAAMFKG